MSITSIAVFNDKPPNNWPNVQTGITSTCIITNIACATLKISFKTTLGINIPIRSASFMTAIYNREYCKAILDVPAFAVLFLPYGKLASIGIDIVSEVINYNQNQESKPLNPENLKKTPPLIDKSKTLDPTDPLNACKILDLPEHEIGNKELIDMKYHKIMECLKKRHETNSQMISAEIEKLINDINIAYRTLKSK